MGNDVIHSGIIIVQIVNGAVDFRMCRLFPLPPIAPLPKFEVLAVSAAERKEGAAVYVKNFASHHVKNIGCNEVCSAASPLYNAEIML